MSTAAPIAHAGTTPVPALALRPKEAARALGIGERKLWSLTNAGELPHARIGRAVVYPVRELETWLSAQTGKGGHR
jgi:excisionase family DNA binding protein